jgi:hypothetical protein
LTWAIVITWGIKFWEKKIFPLIPLTWFLFGIISLTSYRWWKREVSCTGILTGNFVTQSPLWTTRYLYGTSSSKIWA